MDILTFAELRASKVTDAALGLLAKGRELLNEFEGRLHAALLGDAITDAVNTLFEHGADIVHVVEHPKLKLFQSDLYASALYEIVRRVRPELILFAATLLGKDLAPRLAAKLKTGLVSHCIDLRVEYDKNGNKRLVEIVPGFGGLFFAKNVILRTPQIVTMTPGVLKRSRREGGRRGELVRLSLEDLGLDSFESRAETLEVVETKAAKADIDVAKVVVVGGYGVGDAGRFKLVEELAKVLNGAVGATRPVVDAGLATKEQMVGQSGKMIRPELYVGVGVSGAMQHVVGILDSRVILAINKDENAPIFEVCDVGIVGHAEEIVPKLLEELRRRKTYP